MLLDLLPKGSGDIGRERNIYLQEIEQLISVLKNLGEGFSGDRVVDLKVFSTVHNFSAKYVQHSRHADVGFGKAVSSFQF